MHIQENQKLRPIIACGKYYLFFWTSLMLRDLALKWHWKRTLKWLVYLLSLSLNGGDLGLWKIVFRIVYYYSKRQKKASYRIYIWIKLVSSIKCWGHIINVSHSNTICLNSRSNHPEVFREKDVLWNFAKFIGKHPKYLCQSFFLKKLQVSAL